MLYGCYAPYSWNDEEQGASGSYWYLTCYKDVTLITQKEEKKEDKKEDTPPPAASTPAAAVTTPAAPAAPVTIAKVPASAKAKAGKKGKVTVSWKNIRKSKKTKALLKQINGIEVQYSTDPNFATDVNTRTLGKKKTRLTLKLQKKTTYYVRVRYLDGAGGVSDWSAIRQVKTKK